MGVFDWIEEEATARSGGEFPWPGGDDVGNPVFKGTFAVTVGDAIAGIIGQRQTHIFGPEVKMVVDVEDMLANLVEKIPVFAAVSPLMAMLTGIGGNANFYYGSNTSVTYVGPKVDIRRAPELKKTAETPFSRAKFIGPSVFEKGDSENPGGWKAPSAKELGAKTEIACQTLVTALSALLAAGTAGIEIAMRVKYSQFGKSAPPESAKEDATKFKKTVEGYGEAPEFLNSLVYNLPTRIMKFIQMIECATLYYDHAAEFYKGSEEELADASDTEEKAEDAAASAETPDDPAWKIAVVYGKKVGAQIARLMSWIWGVKRMIAVAVIALAMMAAIIGLLVELSIWAARVAG